MEERPWGPGRRAAPAGMSDVERLLAYEEIRQLVARYALALTAVDLDALVELFVPDVRASRTATGRDALREAFARQLTEPVYVLDVGTHVVNLLGPDDAAGTVLCTVEFGGRDGWARQIVGYEDTYARRDGTWYFVRRDHQLFYGVPTAERPLAQPPAEWPRRQVGRGTLPQAWPTWRRFAGRDDI